VTDRPDVVHEVYQDTAGALQARVRLTCHCGGPGETLVRQPYMDDDTWQAAVAEYKTRHPFDEVKRYPRG
jgi:hypothetical protein